MKTPKHGQRKGNFVYHATKGWRRDSFHGADKAFRGYDKIENFMSRLNPSMESEA